MYAVICSGGKQYRVEQGAKITVDRIDDPEVARGHRLRRSSHSAAIACLGGKRACPPLAERCESRAVSVVVSARPPQIAVAMLTAPRSGRYSSGVRSPEPRPCDGLLALGRATPCAIYPRRFRPRTSNVESIERGPAARSWRVFCWVRCLAPALPCGG